MRPIIVVGHCLAALFFAATLGACASPVREPGVPLGLTDRATVLGGLTDARYFADTQMSEMTREAYAALDRERAQLGPAASRRLPPANFLAISGGGDNGAFGAGLLNAWTEQGDRPQFKLVTGVSTGALIAPFAFLGPSYDGVLRHVYTEVDQSAIFEIARDADGDLQRCVE